MAISNRCSTCAGKHGIQIPGRCSECPGGTSQKMVQLCGTCAKGRCVVCKKPLNGSTPRTTSLDDTLGAGPTGFGGC